MRSRKRPRRRAQVLGAAIVCALSIGVLSWVAPPAKGFDSITDMNPAWLLGAVVLELGSCLSYMESNVRPGWRTPFSTGQTKADQILTNMTQKWQTRRPLGMQGVSDLSPRV